MLSSFLVIISNRTQKQNWRKAIAPLFTQSTQGSHHFRHKKRLLFFLFLSLFGVSSTTKWWIKPEGSWLQLKIWTKANWCSNDSSHCPSEDRADSKACWLEWAPLSVGLSSAISEHHAFTSMWFRQWEAGKHFPHIREHRPAFPPSHRKKSAHLITPEKDTAGNTLGIEQPVLTQNPGSYLPPARAAIAVCHHVTCFTLTTSRVQWHTPMGSTVPPACSTRGAHLHVISRRKSFHLDCHNTRIEGTASRDIILSYPTFGSTIRNVLQETCYWGAGSKRFWGKSWEVKIFILAFRRRELAFWITSKWHMQEPKAHPYTKSW